MIKYICTIMAVLTLSSCSYMHIHKQEIVQGNVITPQMVSLVHRGMSSDDVKNILGQPMMANLFSPNRLEYVYTIQPGGGKMSEQHVSVLFNHDSVTEVQQS